MFSSISNLSLRTIVLSSCPAEAAGHNLPLSSQLFYRCSPYLSAELSPRLGLEFREFALGARVSAHVHFMGRDLLV
jgi:hypothetical protein